MEGILFDIGDTLINFSNLHEKVQFMQAAEKSYAYWEGRGVKLPGLKRYFNAHYRAVMVHYLWNRLWSRDFDSQVLFGKVARRLGLPVDEAELKEVSWMWYQPAVERSSVVAGTREMLVELRSAGIKLGVVSNTFVPSHCLDKHLEMVGLLEFFPVRVYSCELGYRKPNPKIFKLALRQLGVKASDCLFVGDMHGADVVGAKAVGMKTVWKPNVGRKNNPKVHAADAVIEKITDLPGELRRLGFEAFGKQLIN